LFCSEGLVEFAEAIRPAHDIDEGCVVNGRRKMAVADLLTRFDPRPRASSRVILNDICYWMLLDLQK